MSTRSRDLRAFWYTMALIGCAALLFGGMLLADINTRRITFGNAALPYSLPDLSAWWERVCDLLPAPVRVFGEILDAERKLVRFFLTGEFT